MKVQLQSCRWIISFLSPKTILGVCTLTPLYDVFSSRVLHVPHISHQLISHPLTHLLTHALTYVHHQSYFRSSSAYTHPLSFLFLQLPFLHWLYINTKASGLYEVFGLRLKCRLLMNKAPLRKRFYPIRHTILRLKCHNYLLLNQNAYGPPGLKSFRTKKKHSYKWFVMLIFGKKTSIASKHRTLIRFMKDSRNLRAEPVN